jgi:hypothetical protein
MIKDQQKVIFNFNWCLTFPAKIPNIWYRFWWRVLLGIRVEKYDEAELRMRVE